MALFDTLHDLAVGLRFFRDLPFYIRRRLDPAQGSQIIKDRIAKRSSLFLGTCRRAIQADGPYARLFEMAGCTIADLEHLIEKEGLQAALQTLYAQGVYLTVEEFKGIRPVVRGSTSFLTGPDKLRNPNAVYHLAALSGRSRSKGVAVVTDMEYVWECAPDVWRSLEAWGPRDWVQAHWMVPGSGVVNLILRYVFVGLPPTRWFSHVDCVADGLHSRYRWSERILIWGSALGGVKIPQPIHVSLQDPGPITKWVSDVLSLGLTPHIYTSVTSAVRICLHALDQGIDISGAFFTTIGEAVTSARVAILEKAGVKFIARYSSMEIGLIGFNCHNPTAPDDMHVVTDRVALIQAGDQNGKNGLPSKALLVSTLLSTSAFDFINFSTGDQADVEHRSCSCPLEESGWNPHLKNIRSFEKLTGGGITFLDFDLIRILEEVLPQRFGGAPTDYQLVEDEDSNGLPVLRLLARPSLGEMEQAEVERVFMEALFNAGGPQRVAAKHWRDVQVLTLERKDPMVTPAGKILHLHQARPN